MPQKILARSQRYYRLALYGAAVLLTGAIIGFFAQITLNMVHQFEHSQLNLFVETTQQIQIRADVLSEQMSKFVSSYEDKLSLHGPQFFTGKAYRDRIQASADPLQTREPLEALDFSFLTTLNEAKYGSALRDSLRLVRDMSSAPYIGSCEIGISFLQLIYGADGKFIAVSPPLSKIDAGIVKDNGPRTVIGPYESILAGKSPKQLKNLRPLWFAGDRDYIAHEPTARLLLPVFRNDERIATVMYAVPRKDFERYFFDVPKRSGLYILDAQANHLLGTTESDSGGSIPFYGAEKNPKSVASLNGTVVIVRSSTGLFMVRRILGPKWIIIHVIRWQELFAALRYRLLIEALIFAVTLLSFWLSVLFFDRYVGYPMQRNAMRLFEAERFNGSVLETLPVGVAIFVPGEDIVLQENAVALRMLGNISQDRRIAFYRKVVGERRAAQARTDASFNNRTTHAFIETDWEIQDARRTHIGVSLSETRFSGMDVLLFGLVNLNEGKANEPLWREALANVERPPCEMISRALMSHEIRTPLHGARGHLELLEEMPLGGPQRERIVLIRRAFDNLQKTVDDILDVTKLQANVMKISATNVSLNQVVEGCAQNFAPTIQKKGVDFYCDTDAAVDMEVLADEHRITQIIHNFLSNSAKFTEKGQVVLSTRRISHIDQTVWVRIEVADTGIGIPAALQSSLFMPMVQADDTIARRFGGTGLGLFLCRNLASLMGGHITMDSEPGKGSIFGLELPVDVVSEQAVENERPLAGRLIEVICKMPRYRESLMTRMVAWGAEIYQGQSRELRMPHISLFVYPNDRETPPKMMPSASHRSVVADPAGGSKPEKVGSWIRISSLSSSALLSALEVSLQDTSLVNFETSRIPTDTGASLDILVAEDEPLSQELICAQLARLGYHRVRRAENGKQALTLWSECPADVTFTDIGMPESDGISLMREIRHQNPSAVVIATTASTASITDTDFAEFFHVLRKPILLADMQAVLALYASYSSTNRHTHPLSERNQTTISYPASSALNFELLPAFEKGWLDDRKKLEDALRFKDIQNMKRGLHRLLGTLLTIGAQAIAHKCRQLENSCKSDGWEVFQVNCTELFQRIDEIVLCLRTDPEETKGERK